VHTHRAVPRDWEQYWKKLEEQVRSDLDELMRRAGSKGLRRSDLDIFPTLFQLREDGTSDASS
jgi:hypothetical protein